MLLKTRTTLFFKYFIVATKRTVYVIFVNATLILLIFILITEETV